MYNTGVEGGGEGCDNNNEHLTASRLFDERTSSLAPPTPTPQPPGRAISRFLARHTISAALRGN